MKLGAKRLSRPFCRLLLDAVACGCISRSMSGYAWPEPADASLSLSAIRAKSGSEDAFIFRMT